MGMDALTQLHTAKAPMWLSTVKSCLLVGRSSAQRSKELLAVRRVITLQRLWRAGGLGQLRQHLLSLLGDQLHASQAPVG